MFTGFFSSLIANNSNEQAKAQRRHTRRDCDHCVTLIDGKTYPVENWSLGGAQIQADERAFGIGEEIAITLKFRLSQKIVEIAHRARIVRKSRGMIAFEFAPLPQQIKNSFQNVVDDYVASRFAASQRYV